MPTDLVLDQIRDAARCVQPPVEFLTLTDRRPDCDFAFF